MRVTIMTPPDVRIVKTVHSWQNEMEVTLLCGRMVQGAS